MHLREKLQSNQRVLTAEITPPKGAGTKKFLKNAELLRPLVDAINVTDCQRALVKMSSLAASRILLDNGVEPVYQLTCRDRNAIALQSDLMGASALGIPNLLCLTGDPVKAGDHPSSKPVFEVEALRLLEIVSKLQSGRDSQGNKMNASTKFFVGAVVNPTLGSVGSQSQMARLERKVELGAQFFQTQANYDTEDFRRFLVAVRSHRSVKILAGILILHTREMAHYLKENIPGIRMPDDVLKGFDEAANPEAYGIELACQMMHRLSDVCDGFHLMTIREERLIPLVLERYHANATSNSSLPLPSPARR